MGQAQPQSPNGMLDGLPQWAKITSVIGIPGFIAIYIIVWLTTGVATKLEAHAAQMSTMAGQVETLSTKLDSIEHLNRSICIRLSKTVEQAASCGKD